MSALPGNPHAKNAQDNIDAEEVIPLRHDEDESAGLRELAQIEATLAVAHELRTANLIAFRALMAEPGAEDMLVSDVADLEASLGLGGAILDGEGQ